MRAIDRVMERARDVALEHREPLLRRVVPALQRAHLLVPAWRLYERAIGAASDGHAVDERGIELPPGYLRMLVAGSSSAQAFLDTGRASAESVREVLAEAGTDLDRCDAVLDFGVGCGRVARWWPQDAHTEWHGCDFNRRLVAWCVTALPHLRVSANPLEPPTTYRDGRFDAVYALSVFTHWPEPLQHVWMRELRRILRPGGRLLFTTHGQEAARVVLFEDERARFDRGELVVRFGEDPGSNLCSTFHPPSWVRDRLVGDADVLIHRPAGTPGFGNQDVWVIG